MWCFWSFFSMYCCVNFILLINGDDWFIWGRLMICFELLVGVVFCFFDVFFDVFVLRFWVNWKNFCLGFICLFLFYSYVFVE